MSRTKSIALPATLVVVFTFLSTTAARAAEHDVVVSRSMVGFNVQKLLVHRVHGAFQRFTARVTLPDGSENFERATVFASIATASVRTDDRGRDRRLREKDFFWCDRFPYMTFQSTRIRSLGDGRYTMLGNLTIRDTTLPVSLDVTSIPARHHARRFRAIGSINRFDFGLDFDRSETDRRLGRMIPVIGDTVEIVLEVELSVFSL